MHDMKISASNFMKQHAEMYPYFDGWASGYCALTYSQRDKESIVQYINNQKEHHARATQLNGLKALLDEAGVAYDERRLPQDARGIPSRITEGDLERVTPGSANLRRVVLPEREPHEGT